ncbi:MAG: NAD(+)/NADH kinase [Mycobacterium leprae]
MRKVALVVNTDKPLSVETGKAIIAWLESRGVQPVLTPEAANVSGRPDLGAPAGPAWGEAELLIVLGGDGTLIRAAQTVAPMGVPILGVNTGHLGFLTEVESAELFAHLEEFLAGSYAVEERMMLSAAVVRSGKVAFQVIGLNDAVISKGPRARMIHLSVAVGETEVARYPADGVIVATPTGSTAYSLSAGGPIVSPNVDVMVVTPICPHTMVYRTIVVAGTDTVTIHVTDTPGEVGLSVDGSDPIPLHKGDEVQVSKASCVAKLVRRESYRFYEVLRDKLANPGR